ncbi:MAG: 1-deoxy-D-xylulose-5-phosphate synthase [Erysipelotrichaceae bacterium]|nr:1-deoxy-D-xylulose-5-phosphate synthase [Erysipelotrichaceae bacterium]
MKATADGQPSVKGTALMTVLEQINKPDDIKKLPEDQLNVLAQEIREYLLQSVSQTGGHLASNLGIVEITIALHRYLNLPEDKLVFDVGHQSYVHKILTGRKQEMNTLRQLDGISGFPDPNESDCDAFVAGHASTALSVALGFAHARDIKGTDEKIVALIGDGSLTGGMCLEALNNASSLNSNLIIVLNDNERSISENVGGLSNYLGKIRSSARYNNAKRVVQKWLAKIPLVGEPLIQFIRTVKESLKRLFISGMYFEDLGITYIGPIDGHDIHQISEAIESASKFDAPVLIHCLTKKGKGYTPAMAHPAQYHGVDPFDVETGAPLKESCGTSFTSVFSDKIMELAEKDERIVAVTAAMPYGTGLYDFKKQYPDRFFDVGIAEEHAITFAGALAASGLKPVVAIYSTFLQRGFDQLLNDICMQKLPVVFAVDRAGLVGNDGKTHQGIFDESFLALMPNLTVMSPKNGLELQDMLELAFVCEGPVVIRYPRGKVDPALDEFRQPVVMNENEIMLEGHDICIMATGAMVSQAYKACLILKEEGYNPTLVNIRFVHDVDTDLVRRLSESHKTFVMAEEAVYTGSYTQRLQAALNDVRIEAVTLPDGFIEHGTIVQLRERYHLTAQDIVTLSKKSS